MIAQRPNRAIEVGSSDFDAPATAAASRRQFPPHRIEVRSGLRWHDGNAKSLPQEALPQEAFAHRNRDAHAEIG
jgi:hypothetical protein